MPEPTNVLAYNRYMYALGNPLKYSDPSGHCATTATGKRDENDGDCWRLADTIANMWGDTDYWQNRYGDVSVWNDQISPSDVGTEFMQHEYERFLSSQAGQNWSSDNPSISRPEQDFGDYTSIGASSGVFQQAILFDDYGNTYLQFGLGLVGPGASVARQDLLVQDENGDIHDIDEIADLTAEKAVLAADSLIGASVDGSIGFSFLGLERSFNIPPGSGGSVGGGLNTSSGFSMSLQGSYTIQIYPSFRTR